MAAVAWTIFPNGWRTIGLYSLYTLYLVFLLFLWVVLLSIICVGAFVPVAVLDKRLKQWLGDTDRRGAELAAVVGYLVLVSAIAWIVPPAAVLVLCLVVAVGAWVVICPPEPMGRLSCGGPGPDQPVYAVPVRRMLALVTMLGSLLVFAVLLTACGGCSINPGADDTMPVTSHLGRFAAWLMPLLLVVVVLRLRASQASDPARHRHQPAHVNGFDPGSIQAATRVIRSWGWRARSAPAPHQPGEVRIVVVPELESEAREFDRACASRCVSPTWRLAKSGNDWVGGTKSRFAASYSGACKDSSNAPAPSRAAGGGFWLAPHWWFVDGVGREDADANSDDTAPPLVGPPYHRAIPARVRQQAHAMLRATQVDMIFIEDGVTFKNIERVLRIVTELYDVHAGRRRAEDSASAACRRSR